MTLRAVAGTSRRPAAHRRRRTGRRGGRSAQRAQRVQPDVVGPQGRIAVERGAGHRPGCRRLPVARHRRRAWSGSTAPASPSRPDRPPGRSVRALLVTRAGDLWAGLGEYGGVLRYRRVGPGEFALVADPARRRRPGRRGRARAGRGPRRHGVARPSRRPLPLRRRALAIVAWRRVSSTTRSTRCVVDARGRLIAGTRHGVRMARRQRSPRFHHRGPGRTARRHRAGPERRRRAATSGGPTACTASRGASPIGARCGRPRSPAARGCCTTAPATCGSAPAGRACGASASAPTGASWSSSRP